MNKKESDISTALIIVIVIFILIIYLASLGLINPTEASKIPEEFKDTKEEAKRKHKRLSEHIKKHEALKIKLYKKFKWIYFFVRLGLLAIWFAMLSIFLFNGFINNLGDALSYSEASILILVALNFLTFGTITNLNNYIDLIKTKTENLVFGKYISIEVKVQLHKEQLALLEKEIKD